MKVVKTPDGQLHRFPNDTSEDVIKSTLSSYNQSKEAQVPTESKQKTISGLSPLINAANPAGKVLDVLGVHNSLQDIGVGALKSIPQFGQTITQLVSKLLPEKAQENPYVKNINAFDWDKFLAPLGSGKDDLESHLAEGMGAVGLAGALGGESIIGQLITQAASAAATAKPEQENLDLFGLLPEGLLPTGKKGAAIESGLLSMILPGMANIIEKGRPSKVLRGVLSPEELAKNAEAAQGTSTGLGRVIGNKGLSDLGENIFPNLPLSNASNVLQKTKEHITTEGENILSDMIGTHSTEDIEGSLMQALQKASKDIQKEKDKKSIILNKAADEAGVKSGQENFSKKAQEILEENSDDPLLERELPENVRKDLEFYSKANHLQSLEKADIFRGKLGDKAYQAHINGDKHVSSIYSRLKEAKVDDIAEALENSSDENVSKLRDEFMKFYREEFAPFDEPEVVKFTKKGGDPDLLLNTFLKNSKVADRSRLLKKLMDKLPDEKKNLVPYAYYSRAFEGDKLNPQKMATLHNQLGNKQQNVLFANKDLEKKMDNFSRKVGLNPEALTPLANPKTGNRWLGLIPIGAMSAGAKLGSAVGGLPGWLLGGILGATTPGLGARLINKTLTSEETRNKLISEMLENRNRFANPQTVSRAQILASALLNASQQGEQK